MSRGRLMPGRYSLLRLPSWISLASSGRRAHIVTFAPPSARILPNVVPQLPAPMTATRGNESCLRLKATCLLLPVIRRVPALRRRRLATDAGEQPRDVGHDHVGRSRQARGLARGAAEA